MPALPIKKIVSIVGARPQFIKAAPMLRALAAAAWDSKLLHTGQHFDENMSEVFFRELSIPRPDVDLQVGVGPVVAQLARMLEGIEAYLLKENPQWVLVFGDTNSTLAGALAAKKLGIPIAHVEAGLRSYNQSMPEEHNRVLTDHMSRLLLCPTQTAVENLKKEGITKGVHVVGDIMVDAVKQFSVAADKQSKILATLDLTPKGYVLVTIHRPYNTDDPQNMRQIIETLGAQSQERFVFPVHPRTKSKVAEYAAKFKNISFIDPVGYLDNLALQKHARLVCTDSGGMQKEAYILATPCITMRPETEWVETVNSGWNTLVGADPKRLTAALTRRDWPSSKPDLVYGSGDAAQQIVAHLEK